MAKDNKPKEVVNAQTPAQKKPVVVDNSAPADDHLKERLNDERKDDEQVADIQPGDPSVKERRDDGTIVERDPKPGELDKINEDDTKPEPGNPPTDEDLPAPADTNGQEDEDEAAHGVPSVRLENEHGVEVAVPVEVVIHQNFFARGFKKIKGEKYPAEINELEKQHKADVKARGSYNDADQSDPMQPMSPGDIARRKGTKGLKTDGETTEIVSPRLPGKNEVAQVSGQTNDPETGEPKEGTKAPNRLDRALKK